jgi:Domain of unknown function (DUF4082)/PEP-CTERM motif
MKSFLSILLLAVAFSPKGSAASALSYSSLNNSFLDGNNRMVGWQFSVTQEITVSAVGWFDWDQNGLSRSHEVGIWNTTGSTLLTSEVIPSGTSATLDNGFRYMTLSTPVALQTGQTYIIAGYDIGASGDPHVWDNFLGGFNNHVNGFAVDARITLSDAVGSLAGSFSFPTGTIGDARNALMGPNLVIVPEPSTTVLMIGGGMLALLRRRKN